MTYRTAPIGPERSPQPLPSPRNAVRYPSARVRFPVVRSPAAAPRLSGRILPG